MEKMENLFRVDDIKVDMPSKVLSDNVAKIAVIGVGGGGCNMINHMINEGSHKIDLSKYENKTYKFGVVADNHLNSKFERLDVLDALYDIYEKEGIKDVYNGGNWVDGSLS